MEVNNRHNEISQSKDSLAAIQSPKDIEWRRKNVERVRWEMFLRNHGLGSEYFTEDDLEKIADHGRKEDMKAYLSYQRVLKRTLSKFDGYVPRYELMTEDEKALAWAMEMFYVFEDPFLLFLLDYDQWGGQLNFDPELSFVEGIKAIDAHLGRADWREICYHQEEQDELIKRVYDHEEDRIARYLLHHVGGPSSDDLG